MTLYYPSGLYGPICDMVSETISEPILYEISRLEPNIDTRKPDTDKEKVNALKNIKLCATIKVGTLLKGNTSSGYGPVCDVSSSVAFGPDSEGSSAFDLCPDDTPSTSVPEYTFKPNPIPQFPIDLPGFKCSIGEMETQLSDGTIKLIKYFKDCVPVVGDFPGWDPTDLGITLPTGKRTYSYVHSLVCGATDYYSSPGIYYNNVPQGITSINFIIFGAGGGSGGNDASNGPSGSGNNSGGTGSFGYLTISLDTGKSNTITVVVGGGGGAGKTWVNESNMTSPGYNRGGYGGYPGPNGVSGAGGGGGGATDVYLNDRLIASIAGGGGGGGNGCNYFRASTGKPWGNWNNKSYDGDPSISQAGLIRSRFSGLMHYPVFNPPIKHSLWGSWFNQYVVWFNDGQDNFNGAELENRVNLNFATTGNYTFEFMGDNKLSIYIASWTDPGEGSYISDILHNGSFPMKIVDPIIQDTTSPSSIANNGYSSWSLVGSTVTFTGSTPTSVTRNITAGRYVLRFIIFNEDRSKDWLYNPAGFAVRIKNPDGSEMWTTRYGFGKDGDNMTASIASGDGGGAGGGGGNEGFSGLVAGNTGLTGGSCGDADSTGQGGSAGWSYIIDHPAVNIGFFDQAPGGLHAGWVCPTHATSSAQTPKFVDVDFTTSTYTQGTPKFEIVGLFSTEKTYFGPPYTVTTTVTKKVEVGKEYDVILTDGYVPNGSSIRIKLTSDGTKLLSESNPSEFPGGDFLTNTCQVSRGKFFGVDPKWATQQYPNNNKCKFIVTDSVAKSTSVVSVTSTSSCGDASVRKAGGGLGGGRPTFFKFRYNGIDYDLVSSSGSYNEVVIPGMGTGVWKDFMNGKTFQYNYFWGANKDSNITQTYNSDVTFKLVGSPVINDYIGYGVPTLMYSKTTGSTKTWLFTEYGASGMFASYDLKYRYTLNVPILNSQSQIVATLNVTLKPNIDPIDGDGDAEIILNYVIFGPSIPVEGNEYTINIPRQQNSTIDPIGKVIFTNITQTISSEPIPPLIDSESTVGAVLLGSYQPAINCAAAQRDSLYKGRSLELAFLWTPIKTGTNSWDTKIRLLGSPDWGLGTGFADNDILPGVMPPSKSQGTQPWWDVIYANQSTWHTLEFLNIETNKVEPATTGQTFNFSVIVSQTNQLDKFKSQEGKAGFVRSQFLTMDTKIEVEN